ncbi:MAG TPA: hypothetical protein VMW08_00625 [Acidimicrobiales bacterium]|nr:hypothetical protein [Acidimicrobiales bacterium]
MTDHLTPAEIITRWRPGSHPPPWDWNDEARDLDSRNELAELTATFNPDLCDPVTLGDDGRVWDGHHRILAALRSSTTTIPVRIAGPAWPARETGAMPTPEPPYTYRCQITRVVDGDTVDARIDLGFHLTTLQRIRLLGINCPEPRGETRDAGRAATEHTRQWVAARADHNTDPFLITTTKADSFGRWLGDITGPDYASLTGSLLETGHAEEWHG